MTQAVTFPRRNFIDFVVLLTTRTGTLLPVHLEIELLTIIPGSVLNRPSETPMTSTTDDGIFVCFLTLSMQILALCGAIVTDHIVLARD